MNKFSFSQITGGIAVMFSVLFLLIIAGNIKNINQSATTLVAGLDTQLAKPINGNGEFNNPIAPANVIAGSFNPQTKGNVIYKDSNNPLKEYHYKAIRSEKLKNKSLNPSLKLEVNNNGDIIWKDVKWSWIDYDEGIMYFHFLTEENGIETKIDNYTGNYQVLLQS